MNVPGVSLYHLRSQLTDLRRKFGIGLLPFTSLEVKAGARLADGSTLRHDAVVRASQVIGRAEAAVDRMSSPGYKPTKNQAIADRKALEAGAVYLRLVLDENQERKITQFSSRVAGAVCDLVDGRKKKRKCF